MKSILFLLIVLVLVPVEAQTFLRSKDTVTMEWTESALATLGYGVYVQKASNEDVLEKITVSNRVQVDLDYGVPVRIRVVPIDELYQVRNEFSSVYSAWYVYGLDLIREGDTLMLVWPDIDGATVEVYRSSDLKSWEHIWSTDGTVFVDWQAIYQAEKVFYRVKVTE